MYSSENDGKMMAMATAWGGNAYPHYILNRPEENSQGATMWNINLDSSDSAYRYNHGRNGWSWNETSFASPMGAVKSPNPQATGRSQLFGDGHIKWRVIGPANNLPTAENRFVENWNGTDSGWVGNYDTSFF